MNPAMIIPSIIFQVIDEQPNRHADEKSKGKKGQARMGDKRVIFHESPLADVERCSTIGV